jgi:transcription elongation factor Elf1
MNSKQCSVCGKEKSLSEYQARKASKDGRTAACRECLKKRDKARYPGERDSRAELMRAYMQTENGKASHSKSSAKWREFNSLRRAAHVVIGNAIKKGVLISLPCFVCGGRAEAHHPDYDRPLDVIWLCSIHHKEAHQLAKELS